MLDAREKNEHSIPALQKSVWQLIRAEYKKQSQYAEDSNRERGQAFGLHLSAGKAVVRREIKG